MKKLCFVSACLLIASPAAADIPQPVLDMIEAAIATGDADKVTAVMEIARITNPDDADILQEMYRNYQDEQAQTAQAGADAKEAATRSQGLLEGWGGQGQIGGFQSSGNSTNVGVSAALDLEKRGIDWEHLLRIAVDYQRSNGDTTREQFFASYEPRIQIADRLYFYGLAQYERDRFQGFSGRFAASGGLGYRVIDGDNMQLFVKAGPAWRKTQYIGEPSATSFAVLAAGDFDWKISDNIAFTQDVSMFQEDYVTIVSDTGIEAGISDALTARLSYTVEYDSGAPVGRAATDTLTRFTLIYGF